MPGYRRDPAGKPLCRWCDAPVPKGRRTWCSQKCVDEWRERGDWNYIRRRIEERDKVCRECGGCRPKRQRSHHAEHPTLYRMAMFPHRLRDELWGPFCPVKFGFEVDHIVACEDGGTDDPANLRLLCIPCHQANTARQRREKAERRRGQQRLIA
ncbi:MAG TPA: HNH endonuclease signature motif containing protein [Caldimonas sp.]|nr:HNH endonuclease signature motif containing protein [Caldimonas sp.]